MTNCGFRGGCVVFGWIKPDSVAKSESGFPQKYLMYFTWHFYTNRGDKGEFSSFETIQMQFTLNGLQLNQEGPHNVPLHTECGRIAYKNCWDSLCCLQRNREVP